MAASGLQWLQALAQVSASLSQPIDRNRLLRQITDALATLTSAHNVVVESRPGRSVRSSCPPRRRTRRRRASRLRGAH